MKTKQCRRCYGIKKKSEFHKSSRHEDGLQTWCKSCINEYKLQWRENKRTPEQREENNRQNENRELVKTGYKRCAVCKTIKPLDEFWRGSTGSVIDARGACAECQHKRNAPKRKYRVDNRSREQRRVSKYVYDAIQKGDIVRPKKCTLCNKEPIARRRTRIEFHHTNGYDKDNWFVGIFVCSHCHNEIHLGKIENVTGTKYL